jgi:hypothetical protein
MKVSSSLVALALVSFAKVASAHAETLQIDLYAERPEGSGHASYFVSGYTNASTGDWGVYMDFVKFGSDGSATQYWRCEGPGIAMGVTPEVGYGRIYRDTSQPAPVCVDFYSGQQLPLQEWNLEFLRGAKLQDSPSFTHYRMRADGYIRFNVNEINFDWDGTNYEASGYVIRQ